MDPGTGLWWIVLTWLSATGACVGSFLNVAIFRLPRRCLSVSKPARSFCPTCVRQLTWQENLPLLSFLAQRGRCRGCAQPISWRYPLVEAVTLALFVALALRHLGPVALDDPQAWAAYAIHCGVACALVVCAATDLDLRLVPDAITIPGLLAAPLLLGLAPGALGSPLPDLAEWGRALHDALESSFTWWGLEGWLRPFGALAQLEGSPWSPHLAGVVGSLLGAALGAGLLTAVNLAFGLFGVTSMGSGDVKLLAFLGGYLGWQSTLGTLALAVLLGASAGVVYFVLSGRGSLTPEAWAALSPAQQTLAGSPSARGLRARLATGAAYLPFAPFLCVGAALLLFPPPGSLARWLWG
ncbi:MAG: prepilin peptidase [Planctomycetes bacterium]|nr:prepilin peptidase [Planctomycetota bacterium]